MFKGNSILWPFACSSPQSGQSQIPKVMKTTGTIQNIKQRQWDLTARVGSGF